MRRPLPVLALLLLALVAGLPGPSYAAGKDLVPTLGPVVKAVPALKGASREVADVTAYPLLGKDCATTENVGTPARGQQATYVGKRKAGQPAAAVAVIGVQVYGTKKAADDVVLAVQKYARKCRGAHLEGVVRNKLDPIGLQRRPPAGQRAVAYRLGSRVLAGDGTVEDELDSVWYVARSGRKVVTAVSGRRAGVPTLDQAVALAQLGLH